MENNLWPVIARHFPDQFFLFQDNNAPIHRARDVERYEATNYINSISWPAQSSDLNIIENMWLKLKKRLQCRAENIRTAAEISQAITQEWQVLAVEYIHSIYRSLPRRIRKVIRVIGEMTKL